MKINGKHRLVYIILLFLSVSLITPVISLSMGTLIRTEENFFIRDQTPPTSTSTSTTSTNPSMTPREKVTSEEENIDSFEVNPKSGRWNVTETGTTDDRIIDGNLRLITTENATGSNEYLMTRGLQKPDSNVEYRYKASIDNQSQVEFFRDQIADSCDFEESDVDCFTSDGSASMNEAASNGLLQVTYSGTVAQGNSWMKTNSYYYPHDIYTTVKLRIKGNTAGIQYAFTGGNGAYIISNSGSWRTLTLANTWYEFTETLTSNWKAVSNNNEYLRIYFRNSGGSQMTTADIVYLDYFEVWGNLDYATHVDGGPEDTWDWEDSNEYFYNVLGNVSDFNDGTTENFTSTTTLSNLNSEYLKSYIGSGSNRYIPFNRTGLSIAAGTYKYLAIEFQPVTQAVTSAGWRAYDSSGNNVCTETTSYTTGTWYLFTCTMGAAWTGTETELHLELDYGTNYVNVNVTTILNMVYLYDTALGDLESFVNGNTYSFVNPAGYDQIRVTTASGPNIHRTSLSIDSSIFDTVVIRLKGDSDSSRYFSLVDASFNQITTIRQLNTSFQTFTINVGTDSDWINTETGLYVYFYSTAGYAAATVGSVFIIDYILLKASTEQQQDFTVGFYDQLNSEADLFNLTHHYWNSSYFRYELELYDSNQEVIAYYYSSNQSVTDIYYIVTIKYSIQETQLQITVNKEDGTRVFRADYGDDFTSTSLPVLFAFQVAPNFFISTHTVFYGMQEVWIDYIKAPYKERNWVDNSLLSDTDWLFNAPVSSIIQASMVAQQSLFDLTVPLLDSFSGVIRHVKDNYTWAVDDEFQTNIILYAVDWDDGGWHQVFSFGITSIYNGNLDTIVIEDKDSVTHMSLVNTATTNPSITFGVGLVNDRTQANLQLRVYPDDTDTTTYRDMGLNYTISDVTSAASQEFVIEIERNAVEMQGSGEFTSSLLDFSSIDRPVFYNWQAAKDASANSQNRAGAIYDVVDLIGLPARFIVEQLTNVLNAIKEVLEGLAQGIFNLLSPIITAITDFYDNTIAPFFNAIVGDILSMLQGFLDDVATWIENTVIPLIEDVGAFIASIAVTLLGYFLDITLDAWNTIFSFVVDTIDPTGALGNTVDAFWSGIPTAIGNLITATTFVFGTLALFFVIFVVFWVFSSPFLEAKGDPFKGSSIMFGRMFKGVPSPNATVLGFGGSIIIPLILLLYIALKVLIAAGTLPDIFGGLPI